PPFVLLAAPHQILEAQVSRVRRPQLSPRPQQVQLRQPPTGQEVGHITGRQPHAPLRDLHRPSPTQGAQADRHHPSPPQLTTERAGCLVHPPLRAQLAVSLSAAVRAASAVRRRKPVRSWRSLSSYPAQIWSIAVFMPESTR